MTASSLTNISKLLVANRGEIACRIIRTAHMLGIETIAIYAPADAKAPHVRLATHAVPLNPLPQANPGVGYLDADRIVAIGLDQQADAVHPGYGFLSENAEFAAKVEAAGMRFVGPTPDVIAKMGDKLAARQVAIDAGVPTTPGGDTPVSDPDRATVVANEIGYPVLIKAVAGGGGKGMQIVHNPTSFAEALSAARGIAEKAFGDSRVFIEKYISAPRHIEIQILADGQGGVAILGERDCTVQRRHQKVIEEAPAVFIPDAMREQMHRVSESLARHTGYRSAGTIEYIVEGQSNDENSGKFYFLEVNTRLQVEHPVTEEVYGVDLVEWMLRIADGQTLPPDGVGHKTPNGHSFEARLYAEDPAQGSLPSTGTVTRLCPPDCRFESGIEEGNTVTPFFDPMIAKIITHGNTREAARHRMLKALETLVVDGVKTNRVLLLDLFKQSVMVEGRISTHTFETLYPESYLPDDIAQTTRDEMSDHHRQRGTCPGAEGWWVCSMAGFALAKQAFDTDEFGLYLPEENPDNHHVTRHWLRQIAEEETAGGTAVHYALSHLNDSADTPSSILTEMGQPGRWRPIDTSEVRNTKGFRAIHNPRDRTVAITVDDAIAVAHDLNVGETYTVHYEQTSAGMTLLWQNRTVTLRILPYRAALLTAQLPKRVTRLAEGKVIAPMPGMIARLMVHNGMAVHAGDTLLVLEAMKMESPVVAPRSGTIASMALTEGQTVDAGATLCEVTV